MTPTGRDAGRGFLFSRGRGRVQHVGKREERVENLSIAVIAGLLILLASVASVELGISVAVVEIRLGVIAGNFLGLSNPPWMDFLASFGSLILTFHAIAQVHAWVQQEMLR